MEYPRLGSVLNGFPPEALIERGYGVLGLLYRSPPYGLWSDLGEEGLLAALEPARKREMRLSWHYPVLYLSRNGRHPAEPAWFDADPLARRHERQRFDLDVAAAARAGADHVVTHLTNYPSIQPTDSIDSGLVNETLEWMSDVQHRHNVAVCIECYGDPYWLAVRAARYGLYICLDVGHLALSSSERGSRFLDDASTMAPLVRVIHLWNTRGLPGELHVPYHPDQRPADGWVPVQALLSRVLQYRPNTSIVAEPSFPHTALDHFWDGMEWLGRWLAKQ